MKRFLSVISIATATSTMLIAACGKNSETTASKHLEEKTAQAGDKSSQQDTKIVDPKEIAKCAAIDNQVLRLSCYDNLAQKYGQVAVTKSTSTMAKGSWKTSSKTDPLTDKTIHFARVEAQEGRGRNGDVVSLQVRCQDGTTEAYINWNSYLGMDQISVVSRIEKAQPVKSTWFISTDRKASFMPQPVTTLKKFIDANTYIVNLTPYGENPVTAIFDISNADEAFKDIRKACNW
jgi:type VI secretion system protein VasI